MSLRVSRHVVRTHAFSGSSENDLGVRMSIPESASRFRGVGCDCAAQIWLQNREMTENSALLKSFSAPGCSFLTSPNCQSAMRVRNGRNRTARTDPFSIAATDLPPTSMMDTVSQCNKSQVLTIAERRTRLVLANQEVKTRWRNSRRPRIEWPSRQRCTHQCRYEIAVTPSEKAEKARTGPLRLTVTVQRSWRSADR